MNGIFLGLVLAAFVTAAFRQLTGGAAPSGQTPMESLGQAMIEAAGSSVTLAIGMIGVMTLFLGVMKVAEKGGLLAIIARTVRPLMVRLFPGVPADHPAMGAMVLNISANVLGLGNAATPFGIRAMQELDRLNPHKGTASDPMVMFLAINTSSVTLLPTGVIALRAAAGSQDSAGIISTTLFATIISTAVAILSVFLLRRFFPLPSAFQAAGTATADREALPAEAGESYPLWIGLLVLAAVIAFVPLTVVYGSAIGPWVMPGIVAGMLLFGAVRGVPVYEAFIEGAKDGFDVAIRIIPYLVAILVAIGMLRDSGALEAIIRPIGILTAPLGLPPEALTMGILRTLSGSGAFGYLASMIQDSAIGPDSYLGYLLSTIQGCTETTFYVLAVYFGAVQVRRFRHALAAGLTADFAGVAASVAICWVLFGGR